MNPKHQNPQRLARELIAFYLDAGADALIGEEPVDRMAEEAPPPARNAENDIGSIQLAPKGPPGMRTEPAADRRAAVAPPAAPEVAVMAAREAARNAKTLDELRSLLLDFEGCALRATATQLVFADGTPESRVMFVGEAPGYEEDISGRPLVGRSGKITDLMQGATRLQRTKAYIANVVPVRPRGNR